MRSIARPTAALTVIALLAACEKAPGTEPPPPSEGMPVEVSYGCDGGKVVTATYPDAQSAVVTYAGQAVTMTRAESASGTRYVGGGREWQVRTFTDHEEGTLRPSSSGAAAGGPPIAVCRRTVAPKPAPETPPVQPTPAGLTICRSGDLTLKQDGMDAGAGQRHATYALTNNGPAACTLKGFVTAQWLDADGKPLDGVTVVQSEAAMSGIGGAPGEVAIAPGARAVFFVRYTGVQATDKACVTAARLRATPPGNTQAIEIADDIAPCTDHVTLGPVRSDPGQERL